MPSTTINDQLVWSCRQIKRAFLVSTKDKERDYMDEKRGYKTLANRLVYLLKHNQLNNKQLLICSFILDVLEVIVCFILKVFFPDLSA